MTHSADPPTARKPRGRARTGLAVIASAVVVALLAAGSTSAGVNPPASVTYTPLGSFPVQLPHAVVATAAGVYVAEFGAYSPPGDVVPPGTNTKRHIWLYSHDGTTRTLVAGVASGAACQETETAPTDCGNGGPATAARLGMATGLAVDSAGRIYIAEGRWNRVRVVDTDGTIRTIPGLSLNIPEGMAYDETTDTVLIADKQNNRILSIPATNGTSTVSPTVVAGSAGAANECPGGTNVACGDGGAATAAQLRGPGAVAVARDGVIYVADSHNFRIRKVIRGGNITAFAGNGSTCAEGDPCGDNGLATSASFGTAVDGEGPFGVAVTANGIVYIADSDTARVRRVLANGNIETVKTVGHPKALYARRSIDGSGSDIVVPEWTAGSIAILGNVDSDPPRDLVVIRDGAGSGTVTGPSVDCGLECSATYLNGNVVTLTAVPAADSDFAGWSGGCTGTGTCDLTMTADKTVTATFAHKPPRTLDVTRDGTGLGTVSATGIDCGADCTESYAHGTSVVLTASAAARSDFAGWTGACSGTGPCTVVMGENRAVNATFHVQPPPPAPAPLAPSLNVLRTGAGNISGGGIDCGATCLTTRSPGEVVRLTATPAAGQRFDGWGGACADAGPTCDVTMSGDRTVTATFEDAPAPPPPPAAELRISAALAVPRTIRLGRKVRLRYTLSKPASLSLEITPPKGAKRVVALGLRTAANGTAAWDGRVRGRATPGLYRLRLVARADGITQASASYAVRLRR